MNGEIPTSQEQGAANEGPRSGAKPQDPLVGKTLDGRFVIEEILGRGGMSVVYKAKQLRVNRHVAIKTIRMQLDSKPIYRERFQREISSLCALNHPNIVTVYDCLVLDDEQPYLVMDYLRGRSLETLISQDGPLTLDRVARISVQVCSALQYAHKNGIIHRDLKPGNIVLMDDEMDFVKVVDFGLAKIGEEGRKLTQSGELWGSPPYMSPEQCMGKSGDGRSDLYSFGIVMYEMLAGKDPFHTATTVYELIQCHTTAVPPAIRDINPLAQVPEQFESVIFRALKKDPNERYQSAEEFQKAIVEAAASSIKDSGDLLLHAPNKVSGGNNIDSSVPSGGSAAAYFNRLLDPMANEDVQAFLAAGESTAPPKEAVVPEAPEEIVSHPAPAPLIGAGARGSGQSPKSPASQTHGSLKSLREAQPAVATTRSNSGLWVALAAVGITVSVAILCFLFWPKPSTTTTQQEPPTATPAPVKTPEPPVKAEVKPSPPSTVKAEAPAPIRTTSLKTARPEKQIVTIAKPKPTKTVVSKPVTTTTATATSKPAAKAGKGDWGSLNNFRD